MFTLIMIIWLKFVPFQGKDFLTMNNKENLNLGRKMTLFTIFLDFCGIIYIIFR